MCIVKRLIARNIKFIRKYYVYNYSLPVSNFSITKINVPYIIERMLIWHGSPKYSEYYHVQQTLLPFFLNFASITRNNEHYTLPQQHGSDTYRNNGALVRLSFSSVTHLQPILSNSQVFVTMITLWREWRWIFIRELVIAINVSWQYTRSP